MTGYLSTVLLVLLLFAVLQFNDYVAEDTWAERPQSLLQLCSFLWLWFIYLSVSAHLQWEELIAAYEDKPTVLFKEYQSCSSVKWLWNVCSSVCLGTDSTAHQPVLCDKEFEDGIAVQVDHNQTLLMISETLSLSDNRIFSNCWII